MLRNRRLVLHPTSTPITAQIIYGQSLRAVFSVSNISVPLTLDMGSRNLTIRPSKDKGLLYLFGPN
jgi:hypothetical protein